MAMKKRGAREKKRWQGSEKGQSLVEFAASAVVLMIIVAGVLDLGRAFMIFVALENGAGEGAIFASYHPTLATEADATAAQALGVDVYPPIDNITYRATHESPTGIVDWEKSRVEVILPPTLEAGQHVTVTISYSYTLMTPFMFVLIQDGVMPLTAHAEQVIVSK